MASSESFTEMHRFDAVDASRDPRALLRFLDSVRAMPEVRQAKAENHALLELRAGQTAVDVGCGTGEDAQELGRAVAPGGRAIGVDVSETLLAEARRRAEASGEAVEYLLGSATALPLGDGSVDAYYAERVYQHLDDVEQALREASRVTRAGGRIVLSDQDWETLVIDSPQRATTRGVVQAMVDALRNGWAGRRHRALLHTSGLIDIEVRTRTPVLNFDVAYALVLRLAVDRAIATGAVSEQAAGEWLDDLRRRAEAGRFFCAFTMYTVRGRRAL